MTIIVNLPTYQQKKFGCFGGVSELLSFLTIKETFKVYIQVKDLSPRTSSNNFYMFFEIFLLVLLIILSLTV